MSHIASPVFPTGISLNSMGGPQYNTEVVVMNSGHEQRNQIWTYPLHKYEIGYGIKDDYDLDVVRDHFHLASGRLHSFNYVDRSDSTSATIATAITDTDQFLVQTTDNTQRVGDGVETTFQIVKEYYSTDSPQLVKQRLISKIQPGTAIVSLDSVSVPFGGSPSWTIDETTGIITFATAPGNNVVPKCGYEFYVPVRFDIDYFPATRIEPGFERVPITLVEVRQ